MRKFYKILSLILVFTFISAVPAKAAKTEKKDRVRSTLIERMKEIDYVANSITYERGRASKKNINEEFKKDGISRYTGGPTFTEYRKIMNYKWIDMTQYDKKPVDIASVAVGKRINYSAYETLLKKLSRVDGVFLYKIGETSLGKNLYSIEIDIPSSEEKRVLMYSGLVHSREQGSSMMLLAEIVDLVKDIQANKKDTINLLKKNKIVAVPMVELDTSNGMKENGDAVYRMNNGNLWKCNAEKTDLNKNFPSVLAGWKRSDTKFSTTQASKPAGEFYGGAYLGSAPETKAMMKWMYHYIVIEKAALYMDWHQQGRLIYNGMYFASESTNKLNKAFASKISARTGYSNIPDSTSEITKSYNGGFGCTNDYAFSIALGKYSPYYGSYVLWDGKEEIMGAKVMTFDNAIKKGYKLRAQNKNLLCCTFEIGSGKNVLGGSKSAYEKNAREYINYHIKGLLKETINYVDDLL